MDPRTPILVLVAAADRARADRLADMLGHAGLRTLKLEGSPPDDAAIDVVLSEGPLTQAVRIWIEQHGGSRNVGTVGIGTEGVADVHLAAAPASEALACVCQLLGENVRLRRRLQLAEHERTSLVEEARTDALTGLPNRRAWDERLSRWRPTGGKVCVAILDLDQFKQVNDRHGHDVGDQVLRAAAEALRASSRTADFVARVGGDEFAMLLAIDPSAVLAVLERLRQAVPRELTEQSLPRVTASVGYHLAPVPDYAAADAALRLAKQGGRDRTLAAK